MSAILEQLHAEDEWTPGSVLLTEWHRLPWFEGQAIGVAGEIRISSAAIGETKLSGGGHANWVVLGTGSLRPGVRGPGLPGRRSDVWQRSGCLPRLRGGAVMARRPVPVRHGPLCAGCWDRTGRVKPAAYCGQHGYGHGLPLDGAP